MSDPIDPEQVHTMEQYIADLEALLAQRTQERDFLQHSPHQAGKYLKELLTEVQQERDQARQERDAANSLAQCFGCSSASARHYGAWCPVCEHWYDADCLRGHREFQTLYTRLATLREAVRKYGRHHSFCSSQVPERDRTLLQKEAYACSCGFTAALHQEEGK